MSNCRKCHAPLPQSSNYCPTCGTAVLVAPNRKSRGNGQGCAFKRGKTWTAIITTGYSVGPDGKLHKNTRSKGGFRTKKEALAYVPQLATQPRSTSRSWSKIYDAWKPTHRAGKSTMDCYAAANNYFRPIWQQPMDQIDIDDLQACQDECPKGRRTRENMKALAGLLYKYAIPRHAASLNLGQYLVISADASSSRVALPNEALRAIVGAVGRVPGADYVACQCYLGFRPSELLALDAINYNRSERAFVGGAKTDAGRDRVVTVSPVIQPIIDRLTAGKISGPVFCNQDGGPLQIKQYRAMFYCVLDSVGIENPVGADGRHLYTPHSCRHTFATLLKRAEGSDRDKLELMGHTSTEMLRHYQDVSYEDLRRITDAI